MCEKVTFSQMRSPVSLNYKDLLKFIVCDLDSKEKRRPQCPAIIDPLIKHLKTVMGESEEDDVTEFS